MSSNYRKQYPIIGVRTVIDLTGIETINPVTGVVIATADLEAVDIANGMEFTNIRGKVLLFIANTDPVANLVVTPNVSALVSGYPADDPSITVAPDEFAIIGPFSANYEVSGKVQLAFTGTSGVYKVMRLA